MDWVARDAGNARPRPPPCPSPHTQKVIHSDGLASEWVGMADLSASPLGLQVPIIQWQTRVCGGAGWEWPSG